MAVHNELYDSKQQIISQHTKQPSSKKVIIKDDNLDSYNNDEDKKSEEVDQQIINDSPDDNKNSDQSIQSKDLPSIYANEEVTTEDLVAKRKILLDKLENTPEVVMKHLLKNAVDESEVGLPINTIMNNFITDYF